MTLRSACTQTSGVCGDLGIACEVIVNRYSTTCSGDISIGIKNEKKKHERRREENDVRGELIVMHERMHDLLRNIFLIAEGC